MWYDNGHILQLAVERNRPAINRLVGGWIYVHQVADLVVLLAQRRAQLIAQAKVHGQTAEDSPAILGEEAVIGLAEVLGGLVVKKSILQLGQNGSGRSAGE